MASVDQVAQVRLNCNLADTDPVWTADAISKLVDSLGVDGASAAIWRNTAAKAASSVDMSESGSSRRLSQLMDHAQSMASLYEGRQNVDNNNNGYSYTVPAVRV